MRATAFEAAGEQTLYAGRQLTVTLTSFPPGLRLSGEIDVSNIDAVGNALRSLGAVGDVHLEMSSISFCDVAGIRAFVAHAENRDHRHRLLLHGLPPQLERVLDLVGWGELPGLAFCNCAVAA